MPRNHDHGFTYPLNESGIVGNVVKAFFNGTLVSPLKQRTTETLWSLHRTQV